MSTRKSVEESGESSIILRRQKNCGALRGARVQNNTKLSEKAGGSVRKLGWIHKSGIEWTDYGMNIYEGCSHKCTYCYAARSNRKDVNPRILPYELHLLHREAMKLKPGRILLCTATDPYPNNTYWVWLTHEILKTLLTTHHHILILTKSNLFKWDIPLLRNFNSHVEVGITITTLDNKQAKKFEPDASPPSFRASALREVHEAGIKTFVSLEPWIPEVTHPKLIISRMRDYVDRWIIGRLNHRKVPEGYYKSRLPDLIDWLDKKQVNYYLKSELRAEEE